MKRAVLLFAMLAGAVNSAPPARAPSIIVIAHRGASGSRPEHTLAAYDLAIAQGADFIEPDLVPTRDDVLVARHENEIGGTTDVATHPEFAARRTAKTIDGKLLTGWFVEDFTLAELKTLRARERLPALRPGSAAYDGRFAIPTLAEIIALAKRRSVETGRTIGIYPETKHPTYFASIGHGTDARLVAQLHAAGWDRADAPVFIQSFEAGNLQRLHALTHIRLIRLLDASAVAETTPLGLAAIHRYAWGIGPDKAMLWTGEAPSPLVADAHRAGLKVHPWTFRAEESFLPQRFRDQPGHAGMRAEMRATLAQGIDGFFTDFPLDGVQIRDGAP